MPSSSASSPCRFDVRPSRWLIAALAALSALAPFSVIASQIVSWIAVPLALVAGGIGVGLAIREACRPVLRVVIEAPDRVTIDDVPVDGFRVEWRGPLAFVYWRDALGRHQARSLWPDTLSPALRRDLRLAMPESGAVRRPDSMAP
jgi:toxin CptA